MMLSNSSGESVCTLFSSCHRLKALELELELAPEASIATAPSSSCLWHNFTRHTQRTQTKNKKNQRNGGAGRRRCLLRSELFLSQDRRSGVDRAAQPQPTQIQTQPAQVLFFEPSNSEAEPGPSGWGGREKVCDLASSKQQRALLSVNINICVYIYIYIFRSPRDIDEYPSP